MPTQTVNVVMLNETSGSVVVRFSRDGALTSSVEVDAERSSNFEVPFARGASVRSVDAGGTHSKVDLSAGERYVAVSYPGDPPKLSATASTSQPGLQ